MEKSINLFNMDFGDYVAANPSKDRYSIFQKIQKKFPTLKKLIRADLDSILNSWSGLGYYRRAKNIYEACKIIDKEYKGIFPKVMKKY